MEIDPQKLKESDPEKYWKLVEEMAATVPADEALEQYRKTLRAKAGLGATLESYEAYYELIHGNRILKHNIEPLELCFGAHENGEIFQYLGFRGCRKTSTFDTTLASFLIGHFPEKTGLVTGANDPNAKLITKSIASVIADHPEFRKVFPHVMPDKEKGWGAEGYWVWDTRKTREEWTAQQAKTNDPTFVGGGYGSSEINGKHPTLFLFVDDLHDIDSSSSVTERERIKSVFLTQILKTVLRENDKLLTWVVITGVPFALDDTYHVLEQGGGTVGYRLPCMRRAVDGEGVYVDGVNPKTGAVYDDIVGWWHLAWPENFGVKSIINARSEGRSAFWQMFMIDIAVAKTAGIRYYLYKASEIGFGLPTYGGADPTNVDPDFEVGGKKRSSFALCYLSVLPQGGAVVAGGFLKAVGIARAKEAILQAQTMFSNWVTTAVEGVGGGKVFQQFLRLDTKVRFRDSNLANPKGRVKDKEQRFDAEIAPLLEGAVIRISDEQSPYNLALRRLCDNFFDLDKHDAGWDAGDALYHAVKLVPSLAREAYSKPVVVGERGGLGHPMAFSYRRV